MAKKNKDLHKHFERRHNGLIQQRESWLDIWESCAELCLPDLHIIRDDPKSYISTQGDDKHSSILNGIGIIALNRLASGMQSSLTNPASRWFRLSTGNKKLDQLHSVKEWLWDTENKLYTAYAKSNFYNVTHSLYKDLGCFGTGVMLIMPDEYSYINCIHLVPGTYCLATNHKGYVDTIYRKDAMSVLQLVDKFGYDNCSLRVQNCYDNGDYEEYYNFIHVIEPNIFKEFDFIDNKNMPFISAYYEENTDDGKFLSISGFEEQPFFAPRWETCGASAYGIGPARDGRADISMLQELDGDNLEILAKQIDPPMVADPSVKRGAANTFPKGVTYLSNKSLGQFEPAYIVNADMNALLIKIDKVEQRIREIFYNDLFNMLQNTTKRMTAYETQEKMGEKLQSLGCVADRLQYEYLDLAVTRTYSILQKMGVLEDAPPEIENVGLNIEYIGLLTQARRSKDAMNIMSLLSIAGNLAGVRPDVLDKLNFENALDLIGERTGVDPRVFNNEDVISKIREERAKQMQEAQNMEREKMGAENYALLSKAQETGGQGLAGLQALGDI